MAANSLEPTLPKLPNELLITTVRNFEWTEDIDELRFLWAKLRLVSQMFKETVEDIFAARDISNPTELLKLLPTAMVKLDDLGDCEKEFEDPAFGLEGSLNRFATNGTAIFRIDRPTWEGLDFEEASAGFFEEAERRGVKVCMGDRSFSVMDENPFDPANMETIDVAKYDPVKMEVYIPWKDIYKGMERMESYIRWLKVQQ